MGAARAIRWCAVLASLSGCVVPPWRSYSAAPPSPVRSGPADTLDTGPAVAPMAPITIDGDHEYTLTELIDVAQRTNPETRKAWEQARAAAARLGRAEAVYLPALALVVDGGARRTPFPTATDGPFTPTGPYVDARLELTWSLLDLPRFAVVDEARAFVEQASFAFTRRHQEVMFAVARAFYALDASRARLEAAKATLRSAIAVEEAAQARLDVGLATRPDLLLAREARAGAAFDVEVAVGALRTSEGALAEVVGVSPVPPLRISPLETQRLPERLSAPIEKILDAVLRHRPDLRALQAAVRARDSDVRAARRRFAPRISLIGDVGYLLWRFETNAASEWFTLSDLQFNTRLRLDWGLFEGFARLNDLRAAEAERAASAAELTAGTLRALREAWTAWSDVQTAQGKIEFSTALLAAAEEAYSATLESYRRGLSTLIDLLTAQRDLAGARSTVIESRAGLLIAAAALAFAVAATPGSTQ